MANETVTKPDKRKDIGLYLCLALVGVILVCLRLFRAEDGSVVQVRVSGEVRAEYSLSEDTDVVIDGRGGTNHLKVVGGEAWIEEASCPDGLCVHMGKISKTGQSVICLPNQVVVEIVSSGR